MTTHVRLALRADDDAATRAAKIMTVAGLTTGDPRTVAETMRWIERCVAEYMEVDGLAYDAALDSYRSYYAAIEAIRKQRDAERVTAAIRREAGE